MARDRTRTPLLAPPREQRPVARVDDPGVERAAAHGRADTAALRVGPPRHRPQLGPGRALGPGIGPHGLDLSTVRLHEDAAAHRLAAAHGARAVTVGGDVALAAHAPRPGTPEGEALLAHELGHVAQQARAGVSVLQRDGRRGSGIGRRPPREPFDPVTDGRLGTEDDHVGFAPDSAEVPADVVTVVRRLLEQHRGAVTLELHGYASDDGDVTYNLNLSAHRAAAVQRAVQALLPPGSVVRLLAHGVTTGFGEEPEANRRVGIDLSDRVSVSQLLGLPPQPSPFGIPELTLDARLLMPPDLPPPTATTTTPAPPTTVPDPTAPAGPQPGLRAAAEALDPPPLLATRLFGPLAPPLPAPPTVTGLGWADVHAAARARGTTLSEGDGALVAWHYRTYLPLAVAAYEHLPFVSWIFSSPEDLGTTLSVQFVNAGLRGQYPLPLELFQADVDRTRSLLGLPLGVQTPVLGPTFRW